MSNIACNGECGPFHNIDAYYRKCERCGEVSKRDDDCSDYDIGEAKEAAAEALAWENRDQE